MLPNRFDPQLCGIDEAGRGPLAGPLVMAGCILREPIEGLNDSKKLSETKRKTLFATIISRADYYIYRVDAPDIDRLGMSRALRNGLEEIIVNLKTERYLFDGNTTFGVGGIDNLVKADASVPAVSAASILAKVTRDRIMTELAEHYPDYGFERHKGYGTKTHIEAIRRYGYSPVHRKSFKVKTLVQPQFDL